LLFVGILLGFTLVLGEIGGQLILHSAYGGVIRPEERLVEYDAAVGWRNIPNRVVRDRYGPGKHVSHDALGHRGGSNASQAIASGAFRVIVAGDSFTYGLCDDADTYPQRLETSRPGLEVLNLGVLGYGLDQAYLHYKSDAAGFDADLVLMAFIKDDITRMTRSTFLTRNPKPTLVVKDDRLASANVPVPTWGVSSGRSWLSRFPGSTALFQLSNTVLDRLVTRVDAVDLAERILLELDLDARSAGRRFAAVYLPSAYAGASDLAEGGVSAEIVRLEQFAEDRGILFLNLTEAVRRRLPEIRTSLFQENGHYTEEGNAVVARELGLVLETSIPGFPSR
jgi:hypothetical protein